MNKLEEIKAQIEIVEDDEVQKHLDAGDECVWVCVPKDWTDHPAPGSGVAECSVCATPIWHSSQAPAVSKLIMMCVPCALDAAEPGDKHFVTKAMAIEAAKAEVAQRGKPN